MEERLIGSDEPTELNKLLGIFIERVQTLTVRVEALRTVLQARGAFSGAEFDAAVAETAARLQADPATADEASLRQLRQLLE